MSAKLAARGSLLALVAVFIPAVWLFADPPDRTASDSVRVTIVAITASDKHQDVNPKLKELAKEVRKREQLGGLTGFRVERNNCKPVTVGQTEKFDLVDDQSVGVTVLQKDDSNQRVRLAVKPPFVGEITYSTVYDKFFPIVTRYLTAKDRERLIVAIMVRQAGKDAKEGKEPKTR
jgi:hypothetical protein